MIDLPIKQLVAYAVKNDLIDALDVRWAVNRLLEVLSLDAIEDGPLPAAVPPLEEILAPLLDDAVNFIPARLSAVGMILAAAFLRFDAGQAARIWKRDRRKHASPNSAQTEAACAGALRIQLGGPASYFGKLRDKPFLGDPNRPIEREDVRRSCRLMYAAAVLWLVIFEVLWILALSVSGCIL